MASGPLRFRTPHIEELPSTQIKQAPGFSYVVVSGPQQDPAKNWGTTNRKRARNATGGQTEQQKEALTARQQREIERKIKELNNDNSKDVQIPIPKKDSSASGGGAARAGKTPNTKKILASGKTFAHYLDDEEAEILRTGRRDGEVDAPAPAQRPSKTPLARRKAREESCASSSPAVSTMTTTTIPVALPSGSRALPSRTSYDAVGVDGDDEDDEDGAIAPFPSAAEMDALLNAHPLTFNQARSAPPPSSAPPARKFCETCGYWGRVKCMKCGVMVCSVECKDAHDQFKCLKIYA